MEERTRRSRRPSPALIVATIALIAALAGGAYAQSAINGADIRSKSIAGIKLKNQAVGTAQLRDSAVQSRDIQTGAVTVSKIRSNAVTGPKIAASAVSRSDLQAAARVPNAVVRTSVVAGALTGTIGQASASCNPGETLISGGGGIVSAPVAGAALMVSRPEVNLGSATPARWLVIMDNGSVGTIQFQAYAVCATTS